MSKNYEVLNELVPKTQELHRAIFDKGYEQGRLHYIDNIPYLLHKETGAPLIECDNAYEKAIDYLRSKSKFKG